MRVAVLGQGYGGTVTAAGLASRGHEVCGADVDAMKVDHPNETPGSRVTFGGR
jgi:GDP-mannose 6-dehydrogenase